MKKSSPKQAAAELKRELKTQVAILATMVVVLWAIEIVDLFLGGALDRLLGILPRDIFHLPGIVFAPLLHGGFSHLAANTVPLVLFGWLVMLRETRHFFIVAILSSIIGGLGVWLFGRSAIHIGASITIFGLWGFLLLRGWFERTFWSLLGSVVFGLLYGGLIWGVLPTQPGVSWDGHLFGCLGGVACARLMCKRKQEKSPTRAR